MGWVFPWKFQNIKPEPWKEEIFNIFIVFNIKNPDQIKKYNLFHD